MQLEIRQLSKRYPSGVQALSDVSLSIGPGVFGLLGPNGAGKSTLMRILSTLQEADSGSAHLGELDVLNRKEEVRGLLGYLPQEFGLYPHVTALELLDHFAYLKGLTSPRARREVVAALLQQTNLYEVRKRRLGTFSGGMKQRFGIAQALLGNPRLVIVDEPTAGLDPEERLRFHRLLARIGESVVVLLSTHIVDDVSDLCAHMAVLAGGRVVLNGDPAALVRTLRGRVWGTFAGAQGSDARAPLAVLSERMQAGRTRLHVYAESCPDDSFEPVEPDLCDVYFHAIRGASLAPESPPLR